MNWFLKNTGSVVRLNSQVKDCECHNYGRPWCFGCKIDENYEERDPVLKPKEPSWRPRRNQTHLTPADARFLLGLPERKPFYPRKNRRRYANPSPYKRYS